MGKNKKELDELLSSDSECEKKKEKVKKKGKDVDEEENESDNEINAKPSEKEKKKKKNKDKKCSETKEDAEEVKESQKKKNKKDKVQKVSEALPASDDDDDEDKGNKKKKEKKKEPSDEDSDSEEELPVKKKKQKKIEQKPAPSSSSSSEDEVVAKPKKTSKQIPEKTKIETSDNDDDDEEEEEEVKPKVKKAKTKKETKEDSESEDEAEEKEKAIPSADTQSKPTPHEQPPQKHLQQKSYSSGTWPELFIKNLSYSTTDVGLAEFFAKYGDVEETKVVYDKQSGRSKGVGFCRFYDASSAVKAMEDAGKLTLDGRPIAISYSNERPSNTNTQPKFKADSSYQGERFGLFVGNLSFKSNEQGIKNFFEDCGKIIDIRIAKNEQGKMRGFAHVDFDSSESVDKALKKNGFKLDGRELKLDKSESKPARGTPAQGKAKVAKGDEVTKAKKSGAIIAPKENKVIQFEDSDSEEE